MDKTNFFLASATVIPVLALTTVVARRITFETVSEEAAEERDVILRSGIAFIVLATAALTGWAEFICLRQLETGHAPFGGPSVIWVTLVVLALPTLIRGLGPQPAVWLVDVGFRMMYRGLHPDRSIREDHE